MVSAVLRCPACRPPSQHITPAQHKQATQLQAVPIYANGSFLSTWHDTSVGCLRCNFSDVARRRNGSASSLSATMAPWGALTWSSVSAYPADRWAARCAEHLGLIPAGWRQHTNATAC